MLFLEKSILFYSIFLPIHETGTFCPLTLSSNLIQGTTKKSVNYHFFVGNRTSHTVFNMNILTRAGCNSLGQSDLIAPRIKPHQFSSYDDIESSVDYSANDAAPMHIAMDTYQITTSPLR